MLLVAPASAYGQFALGVQGNWADDFDFGIGARAIAGLPVGGPPLAIAATFDWFYPQTEGIDEYWEINANLVTTPALAIVTGYFGGGLNVAHVEGSGALGGEISDTDVGFNVLGGLMYDATLFVPYAEARFELGGGEQFVLTAGIAVRLTAATGIR